MRIFRVEHNRRRLPMQVRVCESRLSRGRGLLLRRQLDVCTAYLLHPCSAVHTFGMRHAIDILFCDDDGRILEVVEGCRPWRMARRSGACSVWELRAGAIAHWGWRVGDRILPC